MEAYVHDSDDELIEAMEMYEDGQLADRAEEIYQLREQQRDYQRQLIEQHGGSINPEQPGRFVFNLQPI